MDATTLTTTTPPSAEYLTALAREQCILAVRYALTQDAISPEQAAEIARLAGEAGITVDGLPPIAEPEPPADADPAPEPPKRKRKR